MLCYTAFKHGIYVVYSNGHSLVATHAHSAESVHCDLLQEHTLDTALLHGMLCTEYAMSVV